MVNFTAYKQHEAFIFVNVNVIFFQTKPLQRVIINCRDMKHNHVISRRVTPTGGRQHLSLERITTCAEATSSPALPLKAFECLWDTMVKTQAESQ